MSSGPSGYQPAAACFFNGSDENLTRTFGGSAGNRTTFAMSWWMKKCDIGGSDNKHIFSAEAGESGGNFVVQIQPADDIRVYGTYTGSAWSGTIVSSHVLRDPGGWTHCLYVSDHGNGTSADKMRLYVNGKRAAIASGAYTASNVIEWNAANFVASIGSAPSNASLSYRGLLR